MKIISFILTAIVFTFVFTSCSKDDKDGNPTPVQYGNYSALAVGNYWIYELYEIDTLGNETALGTYDSCYVESDTMINGQTYYKMFRPMPNPSGNYTYLRDSLHYIINSYGEILFSSVDFTNPLSSKYIMSIPGDTVCQVVRKMSDKDAQVVTPLGTLVTSNARESFYMYPNWSFNGTVRTKHARYSKDIGLVIETLPFYASDPNYQERRLLRYHVN